MFFAGGEAPRTPLKFYPMFPPDMVAGANVTGNYGRDLSGDGRAFLITMINRLQGSSLNMLDDAEMEDAAKYLQSLYPGLDCEVTENKTTFLNFIGSDAARAVDWGDLSLSEEIAPLWLLLQDDLYVNSDGRDAVDYTGEFSEVADHLSADKSFWQAIKDGDYSHLSSYEDRTAFMLGLINDRRNWIRGMASMGINLISPDETKFEEFMTSPQVSGAGALNIQILRTYIGLRKQIQERFKEIFQFGASPCEAVRGWLPELKAYYSSKVAGVDFDLDKVNADEFKTRLANFKSALSDPARSGEVPALYRSLWPIWEALAQNYASIKEGLGLLPGSIAAAEHELITLAEEISSAQSYGSDIVTKVDRMATLIESINTWQADLKAHPEAVLDKLFAEFSSDSLNPLQDELPDGFFAKINGAFLKEASKPISFVANIQAYNGVIRNINRQNKVRFEEEKQRVDDRVRMENRALQRHENEQNNMKMEAQRHSEEIRKLRLNSAQRRRV